MVFGRCYPRRLPGEGSRQFSGTTGEAQSMTWRSMKSNMSSPFSMTACRRQRRPCSEGSFRQGGAEPTSSICFLEECFCDTKAAIFTESFARLLVWRGVKRLRQGLFFDSLGRVANVSLEGDVCKQAGLLVSFGGLGWQESVRYSPTFFHCLCELCGPVGGNYSF